MAMVILEPDAGIASNPGPQSPPDLRPSGRGPGKTSILICFVSLPTMVGKISTQNSEPRVPFSSLSLAAKNVEVSPGAG